MKTVNIQSDIQFLDRLDRELKEDPTMGPNYKYLADVPGDVPSIDFTFEDAFDSADETYLRFTFLPNFVDEDNSADFVPKIYDFINYNSKDAFFHDLNYIIETSQSLYPKRTMQFGEIVKVEWFSDVSLTDKVLEVDIQYNRDAAGFAINRTTTRKWLMRNGQFHPDFKVTTKRYDLNLEDQISEGIRRRENIINSLQIPTMGFMIEVLSPMSQGEILLMGRNFMDDLELEFQKFIKNSSTVSDTNDPNFGRKNLAVAFENRPETWLDLFPSALGGSMSIRDWLVQEVSI